ncbi:BTAD domain-containing putative transcriptional regulator [Streptomyces sp. NPDC048279]|uniref:BTAD domain-containing putative transcriptional regulator n=1 Tax=Streptomyces sp. NPDC048279 TaxID=3154714 RepID=UPI0034410748
MEFNLLGPLEVRRDAAVVDIGPPKRRALLLRLLLENGRTVPVGRLCEDLWEGRPPASALSSVHAHISRLRMVLEPDRVRQKQATVLRSVPTGYALRVPPENRDTVRFEQTVDHAQVLAVHGRIQDAREGVDRALAMWRGAPLADVRDHHFAERETTRLEQLRLSAEELRTALLLQEGRKAQAIMAAEHLIELDPLREASWALLMRALYFGGRPAEALKRYEDVRLVLARDLGLDPGPALRETQLAILRHDTVSLKLSAQHFTGLESAVVDSSNQFRQVAGPLPLTSRDEEANRLGDLLHDAASGRTAWGVVSGGPGVGKTRLAQELAARAAEAGFSVAWARCSQDGAQGMALPVGPVPQVLERLMQCAEEPSVDEPLPETRDAVTSRLAKPHSGPGETPVLCLVEDVHHASAGFRRLLTHCADTLQDVPLVVLCTVSDDPGIEVEELLAVLARHGAERVQLAELSVAAVRRLLRFVGYGEGEVESEAQELHRQSGGNPFFLADLLRLPAGRRTGPSAQIPPSAQSVLRVRIAALEPEIRDLLDRVAVIGEQADAESLTRVSALPVGRALELADKAVAARLLTWTDSAAPGEAGTYAFSAGLVRQVVLADLTASRRRVLYAAAAEQAARATVVTVGNDTATVSEGVEAVLATTVGDCACALGREHQRVDV